MRISDWSSDVCSSDLALRIAPKRGTEVLMHAFGESFCQTIRQRLHQNRRIIVIIRFDAQHMLVNAVSGRNGKDADPIILRQAEVGHAHIGLPLPLPALLEKALHADPFPRGCHYTYVL